MAWSVLKRYSASALANSVLPTPVGPRNMKEAIGRFGSPMPARELQSTAIVMITHPTGVP